MTRSLLLVSLAAGSLTVPAPAASAATEPAIRAITVRPASPVVGAQGSVRLVIDVVAKGVVRGKDGVTVKVEPGAPPAQAAPAPRPILNPPARPPAHEPARPPGHGAVQPPGPGSAQPPGPGSAQPPGHGTVQPPAQTPARPPAQTPARPPAQAPVQQPPAQGPVQSSPQEPAHGSPGTPAQGAVQPPVQAPVQPPAQGPAQGSGAGSAQNPGQGSAQQPARGYGHGQAPAQQPYQQAPPPQQAPQQAAQQPAQGIAQQPGHAPPALAPAQSAASPALAAARAPVPSPAAGTAPLGGAEQVLPPGMAIPGHGRPALTDPHPIPAAEPAAPKDGVPGANRPLLPPRLVWRLAAHKPVLDQGRGASRLTDDWQTWRFLPDKKLNRFYPAGTWTVTATAKGANGSTITQYASFELRRASKLTAVRAEKSARAGGVRLRGSLTRVDPRGLTDYGPFAKQRLEVLWRPDESSAWQAVGEATTDAAGAFVGTVQGRTDGFWRVRFPGTGHYAADLSKARQIAQ